MILRVLRVFGFSRFSRFLGMLPGDDLINSLLHHAGPDKIVAQGLCGGERMIML
jgi:hypothetical protein